MKNIMLIILILSAHVMYGQNSKKDSLIREVDTYVKTVHAAAEQFLNKQLSDDERIKAITPYAIIYDDKQKEQFKNVALDNNEKPQVRATALNKIYSLVDNDQRLFSTAMDWLTNREAPMVLRMEALQLAGNLSFSSTAMIAPDIYQKLLDDPEIAFRQFAFTKLIIHGDARAQQKLIAGLENPATAPLPAPMAIGILSMSLKKEYFPAVYKVLQQTKDEATRLEAIRALGYYMDARQTLITISRDANEKEPFREAALSALYGGDRENIVQYASPILADKSAGPRLQGIAIQMTIDVRQNMSHRVKAKKADAYDLLIKNIAEGKGVSNSPDVQKVAERYIRSVRPNY